MSLLLSNKILEWQEKGVEMTAYNVGISFLNAIINGDNDHLCFFSWQKMNCGCIWLNLSDDISTSLDI